MRIRASVWIISMSLCGCAMSHPDRPQLAFMEVPPAVRAAFLLNYRSTAISHVTCEIMGNQYVYSLTFVDNAHKSHTVVLNEGGDEIDQY